MNSTQLILPHAMLYIRDETEYWQVPSLVERCGGKVLGVYLFDERRAVHCCEMTPSYEMHFQRSIPFKYPEQPYSGGSDDGEPSPLYDAAMEMWEREREKLDEELQSGDAGTDLVSYFHCRSFTKLLENPPEQWDWETVPAIISVWDCSEQEWEELLADAAGDDEKAREEFLEQAREATHTNGYY